VSGPLHLTTAEKTIVQTLRASFPPQSLAAHCRQRDEAKRERIHETHPAKNEEVIMTRIIAVLLVVIGLFSSGCATKDYVDKKVGALWEDLYGPVKLGASPTLLSRENPIDSNSDRKVSNEELEQFLEKTFSSYVIPADLNRDEKISVLEFVQYAKSGRMLVVYREMDVNGDGKVTEAEFDGFKEKEFSILLKTYDKDRDGQISKGEFHRYYEALFSKADGNNDGHIDDNEKGMMKTVEPVEPILRMMEPPPVMICGNPCVWFPAWGTIPTDGDRPVGYCGENPGASTCPSPTHPGCTNGDVASGNCNCYWAGHCAPFF
jgi:Ca2+-binding EF-hand superfamily protein